jgi:ElaB/YqjD/DUF883 family membrane-anchored ribosome-binding protein
MHIDQGETMSSTYPPGQANGTFAEPRTGNAEDMNTEAARSGTRRFGIGRQPTRDLRDDLKSLKTDLDSLVSRAAALSDDELKQAYGELMAQFSTLRHAAKGIAAQAGQQFSQGVDVTTDYVKERPLQAVGVAAGLGFLLGLLVGRR